MSFTTSLRAGSAAESRGSPGPSWRGRSTCREGREGKGWALKTKGGGVWKEEGRQKAGATRAGQRKKVQEEEEGGVARHLGEHRDTDTAGGLGSPGPRVRGSRRQRGRASCFLAHTCDGEKERAAVPSSVP